MLESMISSPSPTRAEASDVANAIYDGTDAVMLSAETAIGKYAVRAVQVMDRISRSVEADEGYQRSAREHLPPSINTTADAVSRAACEMAHTLEAPVVVVFTQSGNSARRVSRYRYSTPVLAITPNELTYRQLALTWGVLPVLGQDIRSAEDMVAEAQAMLHRTRLAKVGDRFTITAGVPFAVHGSTNMIRVQRLLEED